MDTPLRTPTNRRLHQTARRFRVAPHALELLEARIAPAAVYSFAEQDTDVVKLTVNKGTQAHFDTAVHLAGGHIASLDLSTATWGTEFAGATVTISVTQLGASGDGFVNVGEINAKGIDLAAVTVKGDLGRIVVGGAYNKTGFTSLKVNSMGVFGTATGAPDLMSDVANNAGAITVQGDVDGASIKVHGKAGALTIGGSLIGEGVAYGGSISALSTGPIKIGGDVRGGSQQSTGTLSGGNVSTVTIGGSIIGGSGSTSGALNFGSGTSLKIGGSVRGSTNDDSGEISMNNFSSVSIGGSIIGGSGSSSGYFSALSIGTLTVGGSILGGGQQLSGLVVSGAITTVKVAGDIVGGTAMLTGGLSINESTTISVGGSLIGTNFSSSGTIRGNKLGSVTIGGSVHGVVASYTGIRAYSLGAVTIGGDLSTASIYAYGLGTPASAPAALVLKSVSIAGDVKSSQIVAGTSSSGDVQIGAVTVHGDWVASNLLAGVKNLGADNAAGGTGANADNVNYGDAHDVAIAGATPIVSRIASITIGGRVTGTPLGLNDHFGFVAEQIGSFKTGGFAIPIPAAHGFQTVGNTGDVSIHVL